MYEVGSEFEFNNIEQSGSLFSKFECIGAYETFRSGRDALGFVADDYMHYSGNAQVLLPAYSCSAMVQPFCERSFNVNFYKLSTGLEIDADDAINKLPANKEALLIMMNFWGICNQNQAIKKIKDKRPKTLIIEDFTHILLSPGLINVDSVDYFVASIRKWIGIPDGGIAIKKGTPFVAAKQEADCNFVDIRKRALKIKKQYIMLGGVDLKKEYRNLFKYADGLLNSTKVPYAMSDESLKILNNLCLDSISYKRQCNYSYLYERLINLSNKLTLFKRNTKSVVPFMLPFCVDNRDQLQKELAFNGVYAPVIWPISKEAEETCCVSRNLSNNILAFWIDQRYTHFDMEYIYHTLTNILK